MHGKSPYETCVDRNESAEGPRLAGDARAPTRTVGAVREERATNQRACGLHPERPSNLRLPTAKLTFHLCDWVARTGLISPSAQVLGGFATASHDPRHRPIFHSFSRARLFTAGPSAG
jgi:hypothetical protein